MATALLGLVLMTCGQAGGFGVSAVSWDISAGVPALRAEHCFCFQIEGLERLDSCRQSALLPVPLGQQGSDLASRLLVQRTMACPFLLLPPPFPCLDT